MPDYKCRACRRGDKFPITNVGNDEEDNSGCFTWAQILRCEPWPELCRMAQDDNLGMASPRHHGFVHWLNDGLKIFFTHRRGLIGGRWLS